MAKRATLTMAVLGVLAIMVLAGLPHFAPVALALYRPDIAFAVPTGERRLYLTIDDAPSSNTAAILRVLKKHGVPATFFIIASRVKTPAQLEEIVKGGCSLGNHLRTYRACSRLSPTEFRADFDACSALLEHWTKARFFRPASDFGRREEIAYAKRRGYQTVVGTVFPFDTRIQNVDWLVRIARWLAVPGGIVILHDGDARAARTAVVLDRLIQELKNDGYSFGELEELPNNAPEAAPGNRPARAPSSSSGALQH